MVKMNLAHYRPLFGGDDGHSSVLCELGLLV